MKFVIAIALVAFAACANAGLLGAPVVHDVHHHHHAVLAAPVYKSIYAVQPPVAVTKIAYAEPIIKVVEPAPVVKVLHAAPVVKTVSFGAPYPYAFDHHHGYDHHHGFHGHHGHFF